MRTKFKGESVENFASAMAERKAVSRPPGRRPRGAPKATDGSSRLPAAAGWRGLGASCGPGPRSGLGRVRFPKERPAPRGSTAGAAGPWTELIRRLSSARELALARPLAAGAELRHRGKEAWLSK